ncbi:MAG: hypothetical protein [Caudoviricetes sp.]|nr:MAG: hypothetical protein [Caudoviricetes sp.]
MFAYWVVRDKQGYLNIGLGQNWSTFEPGTAPIYVHHLLDYHAINGQLFLDNKIATLVECKEEGTVVLNGVFVLALNHKDAMEMLYRDKP